MTSLIPFDLPFFPPSAVKNVAEVMGEKGVEGKKILLLCVDYIQRLNQSNLSGTGIFSDGN